MSETRIIIAFIFAFVLSISFRRSWRWEEDKKYMANNENRTGETFVYMSPFVIMSVLMLYLVMFVATQGVQRVFYLFADVIANVFPYYIALIIVIPFLRKYVSAKACALLWLLPLFLFYQPNNLFLRSIIPAFTFYIPEKVLNYLFYIWLVGVIVMLVWKFVTHIHFRKQLLKDAEEIHDKGIKRIWKEEYEKSGYKQKVTLYYSEAAKTPLSMGLFTHTRVIVLPYKCYEEEELRFTFQHEITHLKRLDIDTKVALSLYQAIGWFHPLIWIAIRKANEDLELSCDELVLKECSEEQRMRYGKLLLQTAGDSRGFTTCLSVDAKALRYRLKNVVKPRKVFRGTILIGIIFFCFYMSYGMIAFTTGRDTVENLVFSPDKRVEVQGITYYVSLPDDYVREETSVYDEKLMMEYLSNLEVESYVGINDLYAKERIIIEMEVNGVYQELHLSKNLLTLVHWSHPDKHYLLRSDLDWDYLMSCIKF